MYSAAATTAAAAIAALFNPVPALAAPPVPQAPVGPAVPDVGSRPIPLGTLTLPGQTPTSTPTASPTLVGVSTSPVLQKIEKGRAEIATLGDQLIVLGQDRDLARQQHSTAEQKYDQTLPILQEARAAAANAAAQSMIDAAAAPPGTYGAGLVGLDDLARLQRGDGTQEAVARQMEAAQTAVQLALDEETLAEKHYDDLVAQYNKLNAQINRKQAAQQAFELAHADELSAAESTETAADSALGAQYLAGAEAGRGADPRAIHALEFALAQRGDPYVWSEEGPDQYDCSGLMYAAYHSVGYPLMRVSRDQYWQTRNKVVDRYSLLPGDLLFFSYSNSWRGIHHVAMYAGNGMMVEAPRTGLNVRLTPVRWTRLFQATRVFGSVEGVTEGPALGNPDPEPTSDPTTTSPTPTPSKTSKPTTPPTSSKPTTPPTSSSPTPTPTPSASSSAPSTPPSSSSAGTPTTSSSASQAAPTTSATTTSPAAQQTTPSTPSAAATSTSSATASEKAVESQSASASSSSSGK